MEILPGFRIVDLGLYLEKEEILVITDVHLGYEEALNKQGILIPKFHFKDLMKRLKRMVHSTSPKKIIVNGDLKHDFGRITDGEWRNILKFLDYLLKSCDELVLLKGNHDKVIDPIAEKRKLDVVQEYRIGSTLFCHGDFIPKDLKDIETIIIGHEHPAVTLSEGMRTERFKCFLLGKWKGANLIVLPSMNLITEGTDITREKVLSPFLKQDLEDFDVWIVADDTYHFGKSKNL